MTVYVGIEFIILISLYEERRISQFTLKNEAAGSVETSVHIIAYKIEIQNLTLFKDAFRPSSVEV